jgi:hypothetical protein
MKKIVVIAFTLSLFWVAFGQVAWGKSITNIRLDPPAPSTLVFGQEVNVSFDYQGINTSGLRIFVRPYSGQNPSPRYTAEGSPSYPAGAGHGSGSFTIRPGDPVTVDAIKISVYGDNGQDLLFEFLLPVKYAFKSERMVLNRHLEMTPAEPLRLRESRLMESPALAGPRMRIRPDLSRKLVSRVPLNIPQRDNQVLYQQVPSIRPPDSPSGTDQTWNDQMNNWLNQLNHVLLAEIQLVVEDENTVRNLVEFEEGEDVSVYDQVGLRLYFLRLTQFQRTSEESDEGNE